jgi:hypothetical protein
MEADWEFEVGPDAAGLAAPVIDALWPGFVDLRRAPELAWHLPEAAQLPALAEASGKAECRCLAGLDLQMRFLAEPRSG